MPTPQADNPSLRSRDPTLVDEERGRLVRGWCDWVGATLNGGRARPPEVLVHGDFHEAQVPLPGGGDASSWVDDLAARLRAFGFWP